VEPLLNETDVKIKGRWTYLYRAVDKQGKTVDFLVRAKRDVAAAKAFFRRAFKSQGRLPRAILMVTRLRMGGAENPQPTSAPRADQNTVLEIFEQSDRTGPSIDQTSFGSNAWIEALSVRLDHHRRHRTHASHQERSVQTRKASH
jgi:hypothetical protein